MVISIARQPHCRQCVADGFGHAQASATQRAGHGRHHQAPACSLRVRPDSSAHPTERQVQKVGPAEPGNALLVGDRFRPVWEARAGTRPVVTIHGTMNSVAAQLSMAHPRPSRAAPG